MPLDWILQNLGLPCEIVW